MRLPRYGDGNRAQIKRYTDTVHQRPKYAGEIGATAIQQAVEAALAQ